MTDATAVFDRRAVRLHRERGATIPGDHDFLFREIADRLADRLADMRRDFASMLDLGGGHVPVSPHLAPDRRPAQIVATALSPYLLQNAGQAVRVACDEEFLPFAENAFDLVTCAAGLHWINDLPGALIQIARAMRPDGLFVAALLGGDTLVELRRAFLEAEAETTGGVSPHTSPVADVADAGALLQRAGFALPVVDSDTLTVTYADMFALMRDLRGMGETNAVAARNRRFTRRDTLLAAAARYRALYGDADGRIPATFQIIWMTGWKPAGSQQRPLRPGSATARLADALDAEEKPAGDKADPDR